MNAPLYLTNLPSLHELAVGANADLGMELLTAATIGRSAGQLIPMVTRVLAINDSFTYIAMPNNETLAQQQHALDYLLSRLPRPSQPRQVINTLVEYQTCFDDEEIGIPDAPTLGIVADEDNVFSCVPNPLYLELADYEIEIAYAGTPPAPTVGIVDDAANRFSFLSVPGLAAISEYEYQITA